MQLRKATRQKAKLRIGLSAPSGFGKTYSALLLAYGITGDWSKIALIDTENGSGELYSHLGDYNALPLEAPYSPERYIEAIRVCENAGMEVIIIDSISHEWEGVGGILEQADSIGGGFQSAWKQLTPRHEKFKQAIITSKAHTITTARRKQDYVLQETTNRQGKTVQAPVKAGFKEVTREGWEYELTVNLEIINANHYARASKDRTGLFADRPEFVVTVETGQQLKEWSETGVDVLQLALKEVEECTDVECTKKVWHKYPNLKEVAEFKSAVAEKGESLKAEVQEGKVVEQEEAPATEQGISNEQAEQILELLKHPAQAEATVKKVTNSLYSLSFEKAAQTIEVLQKKINTYEKAQAHA
ncbi:signal recognition particle subunit FFH/SRP54 (srp54) [Pontibacter mucosus]|uniref:Signal recognition particle subunit FFH/SRP54 (Srp54) n=1 Tax=Pontibacter mucosus TaxID=1649266 RepID=A0A2T5YD05_9BACT|nr:AAA family ATPase [Pontibacter mucosus]PTX14401.1 signal recognition particle subunit FFH/SRP54 (srp54) [Pontibacter mucosus]